MKWLYTAGAAALPMIATAATNPAVTSAGDFVFMAARAGSLDPDAVRRQLVATEQYAGATRIARYDENRHPTKSAVIMTIENGAKKFYQQVEPNDSEAM